MTDCPDADVRDLLPELASGVLAPEVRARVETHLAGCAECRAELALLQAIRRTFASPVGIDVERVAQALPSPRVDAANQRLAHGGGIAARGRRPQSAGLMSRQLAAALALFAVGATSVWIASRGGPGADIGIDSTRSLPGQERVVTLGHRLGDLTEEELETLLGELDAIDAVPALEPAQLIAPLGGGEGS